MNASGSRAVLVLAAASGTLAVIAGAFGAHGLRSLVAPQQVAAWATASQYHLLHSIVLLALAFYGQASGRSIRWPALLFAAGIVLFSGSIYLLVLTPVDTLWPLTPLGGLVLMVAWASLAGLARR